MNSPDPIRSATVVLAGVTLAACSGGKQSVTPAAGADSDMSAAGDHRFEGDWVRTDTNNSGTFGGLNDHITRASLTAEGAAELARHPPRTGPPGLIELDLSKPHKAGEPYVVVDKPCQGGPNSEGALGINPDSGAIHIIESKQQFVIALERGGARIIHLDGRTHPDASHWTPTAAGHSVGHYEKGEFVVDVVGLNAARVPGEGWRTPETHLTQRFSVSDDGQHMTIAYTYTDPKIYAKPHSFNYTFDRLPPVSYALEEWCDASDPAERQSIVPPPQDQ